MQCSLIITTFNWPEALSLVLLSVESQTTHPDEIIIADDGSNKDTKITIENFSKNSLIPIIHSWQNDKGFRLSKSRNRAIAKAKFEYIIVIDGDMILNKNFIKDHKKFAMKNTYLQGSRVLLQPAFSNNVLKNKFFNKPSFFSNDSKNKFNIIRFPILTLVLSIKKNQNLNRIRGCNFSLFKEDIIKVNGFNEEFKTWGKEDSEFVQRLFNNGVFRRNLKFSGIQYHLFHKEGSSNSNNIGLLNQSIKNKHVYCKYGIEKYL
jgi:glycosyltransferase involved in cell wall biosynthesis